jgi:WhiB family redox-sensing transcriptional regulator
MIPVPSWMERAACLGQALDAFMPADRSDTGATAICEGCPVRLDCLAYAQEKKLQFGTFGGLRQGQRRKQAAP